MGYTGYFKLYFATHGSPYLFSLPGRERKDVSSDDRVT